MTEIEERFVSCLSLYLTAGATRHTIRMERPVILSMLRELYKENKLILITSNDDTIRNFITGYKDWLECDDRKVNKDGK